MAKSSKGSARQTVVVSVSEDSGDQIEQVADRLRAAGMKVENVMKAIGTISGKADPSLLGKLAKVKGVAAAEPSRDVQLPPPDSDVQ